MKEFKREITINFGWWSSDNEIEEIDDSHISALEEHARDKILEMTKEGYTSGELFLESEPIFDSNGNYSEDENRDYTGWWSLTAKTL